MGKWERESGKWEWEWVRSAEVQLSATKIWKLCKQNFELGTFAAGAKRNEKHQATIRRTFRIKMAEHPSPISVLPSPGCQLHKVFHTANGNWTCSKLGWGPGQALEFNWNPLCIQQQRRSSIVQRMLSSAGAECGWDRNGDGGWMLDGRKRMATRDSDREWAVTATTTTTVAARLPLSSATSAPQITELPPPRLFIHREKYHL